MFNATAETLSIHALMTERALVAILASIHCQVVRAHLGSHLSLVTGATVLVNTTVLLVLSAWKLTCSSRARARAYATNFRQASCARCTVTSSLKPRSLKIANHSVINRLSCVCNDFQHVWEYSWHDVSIASDDMHPKTVAFLLNHSGRRFKSSIHRKASIVP